MKNNSRLYRHLVVSLLVIPLASCNGNDITITPTINGLFTPPSINKVSATPTMMISNTPMETRLPEPTATVSPWPTISYPVKLGPVITRDNIGSVVLLGAISEKFIYGDRSSQIAWSPDSKQLAFGSDGEGVRIIDPINMKEIAEIRQNIEGIHDSPGGISYTPDGKAIAVSIPQGSFSNPGDIAFYDPVTLTKVREDLDAQGTYSLSISHNGKWLAWSSHMGGLVLDLSSGKTQYIYSEEHSDMTFTLFSWDDKHYVAYGIGMFTPIMVNTTTWEKEIELTSTICFSPNNELFAMQPGIWKLDGFQQLTSLGSDFTITYCEFGKINDILISVGNKLLIDIWDVNNGAIISIENIGIIDKSYVNIALSPDGKIIAALNITDHKIEFWGIIEK